MRSSDDISIIFVYKTLTKLSVESTISIVIVTPSLLQDNLRRSEEVYKGESRRREEVSDVEKEIRIVYAC